MMTVSQYSLLKALISEHWEWSQYNFGAEQSWRSAMEPALGIGEEMGELADALLINQNMAGIKDAFADVLLYMADLSNRVNLQGAMLPRGAVLYKGEFPSNRVSVTSFLPLAVKQVGIIQHCILKMAQGIRQDEDHVMNLQAAIYSLADILFSTAASIGLDILEDCLFPVWEKVVSKRDWRRERDSSLGSNLINSVPKG